MDRVIDSNYLHAEGNWRLLWKFDIPPKVKHFLWILYRDLLPTRSNLVHKHVDVIESCLQCSGFFESLKHLFIYCLKATTCWNVIRIFNTISACASQHDSYAAMFFFSYYIS